MLNLSPHLQVITKKRLQSGSYWRAGCGTLCVHVEKSQRSWFSNAIYGSGVPDFWKRMESVSIPLS